MTGSSFRYLVKEGFKSIRNNQMMSVASILVLLSCMLLIGASALFSLNINATLKTVEGMNEIRIFLKPNIDPVDRANVEEDVNALPDVASITYISKEDAANQLKEKMGEAKQLLEEGDTSFLPECFVLTLKDITKIDAVRGTVEKYAGVEQVTSTSGMAATLVSLRTAINLAGGTIVAMLIIVSLVITGNTIKLTVFNRRKEISIMKFVGATDGFIRLPFVIEGVILGLITAVIAFLITWGYYSYLVNAYTAWATGFLSSLSSSLIPFSVIAAPLLVALLIGGLLVGGLGSLLFVRKYLKV